MKLTDRQREFIINHLKNGPEYVGRKNRFKKSKMKKYISDKFYPLNKIVEEFINDFDLLHTYFSSETSWKWHSTDRAIPDRKLFKFLKENFDLDNIRTTNIKKMTSGGIKVELIHNKNKTSLIIDDDIEIKFDSKEIDRFNPLPAPDVFISSLIKKYGEQKIKEAIKRSGL